MGLALRQRGAAATLTHRARLVLPPISAEEAALVPDTEVYRAHHLRNVVAYFAKAGMLPPEATPMDDTGWARIQPPATHHAHPPCLDLADVKGQAGPRRALEIAAAGGHSLLLVGPPGTGKSMLAQRFAGLLPDMTLDDFMAALDKSDNIDEITTKLVDDELERELKQLNDQVEKLRLSQFGE